MPIEIEIGTQSLKVVVTDERKAGGKCGSALAGAILYWALGSHGSMGANLPNAELGITGFKAFALESFLSFFMMLVIRGSFAVELPVRQFAAIPIGAVVGIEVMLMGPVAGAAMNPARRLVPTSFSGSGNFIGSMSQGHFLE